MKLRTLFLFADGVVTGLMIAKKLAADDEEIVHGPQQVLSSLADRLHSSITRDVDDATAAFAQTLGRRMTCHGRDDTAATIVLDLVGHARAEGIPDRCADDEPSPELHPPASIVDASLVHRGMLGRLPPPVPG